MATESESHAIRSALFHIETKNAASVFSQIHRASCDEIVTTFTQHLARFFSGTFIANRGMKFV
jgi:hypothetical protein